MLPTSSTGLYFLERARDPMISRPTGATYRPRTPTRGWSMQQGWHERGRGEREREKDLIKEGGREGGGETRSHRDFQIEGKERIFEMDYTSGAGVKLGQEK